MNIVSTAEIPGLRKARRPGQPQLEWLPAKGWASLPAIFQSGAGEGEGDVKPSGENLEPDNPLADPNNAEWEAATEPIEPPIGLFPPSGSYSRGEGPLLSYGPGYADSFSWYLQATLEAPATYYRIWGSPAGLTGSGPGTFYSFFDPRDFSSSDLNAFRDQISLAPAWNSASNVTSVTIPAGTTVFIGPASPQQGYNGAGFQVFVPKNP